MTDFVCDDENVEEQAGEPVDDGWTETILGEPADTDEESAQ